MFKPMNTEELIQAGYYDGEVDVIVRDNGRLVRVHERLDWHTAVEMVDVAFKQGFLVGVEESNN